MLTLGFLAEAFEAGEAAVGVSDEDGATATEGREAGASSLSSESTMRLRRTGTEGAAFDNGGPSSVSTALLVAFSSSGSFGDSGLRSLVAATGEATAGSTAPCLAFGGQILAFSLGVGSETVVGAAGAAGDSAGTFDDFEDG